MIRVGIVGCNFGRQVLLPAFRLDPRCEVVALAGGDAARTAELAKQSGIPQSFGDWSHMIDQANVDAVAIATPPKVQPAVACKALERGKAVFLEKPISADDEGAYLIAQQAKASGRPVAIDFEFAELPVWRRAKELVDAGALGALRHIVVTWNVENYATQMRLKSWKTTGGDGGGVIGNFCSHSFYYLEHFGGRIADVSASIFGLPGEDSPTESTAVVAGRFESGAAYSLTVSAASYLGSGHRIEIYGEDGTLALINPTTDYMRGFELFHARRPAKALERVAVAADDDLHADGRIAPVAQIVRRFIDSIETGAPMKPGVAEGCRVQKLMSTAWFSRQISSEGVRMEWPST